MEGEAAMQAWRAQDFVATSLCPPSPPLASRFEVGEMGRAWENKKRIHHLLFFLFGVVTPAPWEETQTQRNSRKQESSCLAGAALRQSRETPSLLSKCRDTGEWEPLWGIAYSRFGG